MKILDVNVVLAAHRADHPHHAVLRPWFDALVRGEEVFSVPDEVWAAFVRIATNRRIFPVPTPLGDAFEFVRAVTGQPNHVPVTASGRRMSQFEALALNAGASGDLAPDAFLAALAVDQGCTLVSLDRDFARFDGLRWERPGSR